MTLYSSRTYTETADNVYPFAAPKPKKVAEQNVSKTKAKLKQKNVGHYFKVDSAAIDAIDLHPPLLGISKYDLQLAYLVMCKHVQQGIQANITTAGAKAIRKALLCGERHKNRVFEALKQVAFPDGMSIIGQQGFADWDDYKRPTYELQKTENSEYINFPNKTFDKLTANPKTANRKLDKTRASADAIRLFMIIYRYLEPIEFFGYNPFYTLYNEYGNKDLLTNEPDNAIEEIDGYRFTFYEKPRGIYTGRVISPNLASEFFHIPSNEVTPEHYQKLHRLRTELYKRGYLMYSVFVVDKETKQPLYRLYTSDHDKNTNNKDYKPLQDDVISLYKMISGSTEDNAMLKRKYFISATREQETDVIGIYSPKFFPSCPESAIMKKNWAENTAFWVDFCQCMESGL